MAKQEDYGFHYLSYLLKSSKSIFSSGEADEKYDATKRSRRDS